METVEGGTERVAGGRASWPRRDLVPLYAAGRGGRKALSAGAGTSEASLAPLLRPLTLAVFLAYTILPVHQVALRAGGPPRGSPGRCWP